MSRGKYLSLPEARKKKQFDRFAKEHPSEGDADKLDELMRQQYLVPRKSVKKLREMSRREGVSAGELARRAIEAFTSGNVLTEPEEEAASRTVLKDIHTQVRAVLTRIDASVSEIRASERALADGTFRARVVAETRAWFDAHPEEAQGILDIFAPRATA